MPTAHVYMWSGRDSAMKKGIIAGMTQVFVDHGVPAEAVTIIIHDVPKENWGSSGIPATEKYP